MKRHSSIRYLHILILTTILTLKNWNLYETNNGNICLQYIQLDLHYTQRIRCRNSDFNFNI
jgi:hypothetical protein